MIDYCKTKDGEVFLIREMETSHIKKCMEIIQDNDYKLIDDTFVTPHGSNERILTNREFACKRGEYERMHLELRLGSIEEYIQAIEARRCERD